MEYKQHRLPDGTIEEGSGVGMTVGQNEGNEVVGNTVGVEV